jgi:hypothetical protein
MYAVLKWPWNLTGTAAFSAAIADELKLRYNNQINIIQEVRFMKKLLSILLAGMMLLSLTGAMAENAMELTAGITIDTESALSMAKMLAGMTDEAQLGILRSAMSVVNSFTAVTAFSETGGDVSFRLSGQEFANVIFSQNEGKIAVTSTLFPNYALTIDPAELEKAMGQSGIKIDPQMAAQAMEALKPYGQDFESFFGKLAAEAITTQGAFTVDGILYSSSTSMKFTSDQFLKFALTIVERAQADKTIQDLVAQLMTQAGSAPGASVAEILADARKQISDTIAKGSMDLASFKQYANDKDSYIVLETVPQETMTFRFIAKETKKEGGSSSTYQLFIAETAVTDWDAAIQEIQGGQSSKGVLLQGTMDVASTTVDKRSTGSLQVIAGSMAGMSLVLTTETVEPFDVAAAKSFVLGLGLGAGKPLVKFSFSAVPAQTLRTIDLTGKTLIAITSIMDQSLLAPLENDITANGIPALLKRLQEVAPEASLLISLLTAGSQPQGQPVPASTTNP